jgi:hypothetical protein
MAKRIFISYRREDAAAAAGRVYDRLCRALSRDYVFMDVSTIRGGDHFPEAITATLERSDAVLVFIGRKWLEPLAGRDTPRIWEENDYVRAEVRLALANPARLVLPVLVDGAQMPKEESIPADIRALRKRNALPLRHERFDDDTENLLTAIFRASGKRRPWDGRGRLIASLGYVFVGSCLGLLVLMLAALVHLWTLARPLSASIGAAPTTLLIMACAVAGGTTGLLHERRRRRHSLQ